MRTRICNRPFPSGGGKMCHILGPSIQVRRCNRKGCPGKMLFHIANINVEKRISGIQINLLVAIPVCTTKTFSQ